MDRCTPAWPIVPPDVEVLLLLMEFGFGERGREGVAGLEEGNFSGFLISGRVGAHGRVWPVFSAGDAIFLLLMELGVAGRGRN